MILVDTSVWVDHLHRADAQLIARLADDEVGCHPLVIEELALGSIAGRDEFLELLANLTQFATLQHDEILHLIDTHRLWSRGLSAIDVALLGSTLITDGATFWTRDKRLGAVCAELGVRAL